MTGFAADWLALREPYDEIARDRTLLGALAEWAGKRPLLHVMDFGAGTGSARRGLSSFLPADACWTLIEYDPLLIAAGEASFEAGANVCYRQADLNSGLDRLFAEPVDLVTASALIDLVSSTWIDRLATHLIHAKCAAWIGLTYDGGLAFEPRRSDDDAVIAAFNRDMTRDKGFGPALGAAAHEALAERLEGHGTLLRGSSPWLLGQGDDDLIQAMLEGIAGAAAGVPDAELWQGGRLAHTTNMRVGHADLLFLP